MAESIYVPPEPDISHLITEDDAPVDSILSEKQMRLLTQALYTSWKGRRFAALANVGIFSSLHESAIVPDVMLSLNVTIPRELFEKKHHSYLMWEFGKPPEVVIEIVSNRIGGEMEKLPRYAAIGVAYVVIYDPEQWLGPRVLRAFERDGAEFVEMLQPSQLRGIDLGLVLWQGIFEGIEGTWLRWCDAEGRVLLTGEEAAQLAARQADEERQRADAERQRADAERQRAERLLARLQQLGEAEE